LNPRLNTIVFELNHECNLDCRYCYNIWKIQGKEQPIRKTSYKQAINTLSKFFRMVEVGHVSMSGGEPLLTERFAEIVLFTRMKRKGVTIISNGTAGSEEEYKTLISLGAKLFEFPLHSDVAEIHEDMTRCKGSWQASVGSIVQVLALGGQVVTVIILSKINHERIAETLAFHKNLGINRVMLNRFNIGGEGIKESRNLLLSKDELENAFIRAGKVASELGIQVSSNVCFPECYIDQTKIPNIYFTSCSNDISRMPVTLDIDGNVRICNHSPVVLGNIFKDKANVIFNHQHIQDWKTVKPSFCDACDKFDHCLGGCRAAALQVGNTLDFPDPVLLGNENR